MEIQLIQKPLHLNLYGFSGTAINQDYGGTGFKLMNRMWEVVKSRGLKNKGVNVWVYEPEDRMFAGVELEGAPRGDTGLEHKEISLSKYAYYKHVGSYSVLKQVYASFREELKTRGIATSYPGIEIYGHWEPDDSKLETEILMAVRQTL